jgi:hypothetical protein
MWAFSRSAANFHLNPFGPAASARVKGRQEIKTANDREVFKGASVKQDSTRIGHSA